MCPREQIRKIEDLNGRGSLIGEDQKVYPVSYRISVHRKMVQPLPKDDWIPGLFQITGQISPPTSSLPKNLSEQYILRLKDGTEFEVSITRWTTRDPYCDIAIKAPNSFFDRYK